jgi:hypothetical protein
MRGKYDIVPPPGLILDRKKNDYISIINSISLNLVVNLGSTNSPHSCEYVNSIRKVGLDLFGCGVNIL